MTTLGAYAAKTHFSEVLDRVENGETVTVTRHGVAVARIVPIRDDFRDALSAMKEWRRYRQEQNITLGEGVTIKELIEEGRR